MTTTGSAILTDDGALHVGTAAPAPSTCCWSTASITPGQPPQLCSQDFYDDCFRALAPGGVLVVNLHVDHPGTRSDGAAHRRPASTATPWR